jgi:hypothetical protein
VKRYFFYSAILLVLACKGKPGADASDTMDKDSIPAQGSDTLDKDSMMAVAKQVLKPGEPVSAEGYSTFYTAERVLAIKNFAFSVQSRYEKPDSVEIRGEYDSSKYFRARYLIVRDLAAKVADTMDLGDMSLWDLEFEDMTDSLKFKSPVVKLEYHGDSDQPTCDFIEFKNGKLKHLFGMIWLKSLKRKDANTLSGVVYNRDEVVYCHIETPITVNLADGEVTEHIPDVQYIGNGSKALEPVTTYRVKGKKLSVPYIIKPGTEFTIDTIYRKQGVVRMMVSDSIPVYIMKDSLHHGLIWVNTAG